MVSLIFAHGIAESDVCKFVPKNVEGNASFLVNTQGLKNLDDIKCDDCGCWVNNGVRKIYLSIKHHDNPKKMKLTVINRGGKPPSHKYWCLTRTYYIIKDSKDFRKITMSLQGMQLLCIFTCIQILTLILLGESGNCYKATNSISVYW